MYHVAFSICFLPVSLTLERITIAVSNVPGVVACPLGAQYYMCTEPHVCVNGVDTTAPELDLSSKSCQSNVYSIYLDGGNQNNQGYSGAVVHGNVMTAAWGGAVFVNGGGNVNVSNNVILDGRLWQLSMPC